MSPHHVLVVLAAKDPGSLLLESVGGGRPPLADYNREVRRKHERKAVMGGFDCSVCGESWEECPTPGLEFVERPARWTRVPSWLWDQGLPEPGKPHSGWTLAVILWWEGQPDAMGCDRAARACGLTPKAAYTQDDALYLARTCEATGYGTPVVVEVP